MTSYGGKRTVVRPVRSGNPATVWQSMPHYFNEASTDEPYTLKLLDPRISHRTHTHRTLTHRTLPHCTLTHRTLTHRTRRQTPPQRTSESLHNHLTCTHLKDIKSTHINALHP